MLMAWSPLIRIRTTISGGFPAVRAWCSLAVLDFDRRKEQAMAAENPYGFAPTDNQPIRYLDRIRNYYLTLGYGKPYSWAHYVDAPFTPLAKPVADSRVALVTTAAPYQPDAGDQGPWSAYNSKAKFYQVYSGDTAEDHDLRISHIGIDRKHTSQEDSNSWFPLPMLRRMAEEGVIGEVSPRFFGSPTNRSHRTTIEVDAAEIVQGIKEDGADVAVLVAN
jgi:D-proline reductase (dithiol) PrdB